MNWNGIELPQKPYYSDDAVCIVHADCREILASIRGVSAVVTDPPYNLTSITKRFSKEGSAPAKYGKDGSFQRLSKGFMGKEWDGTGISFCVDTWRLIRESCLFGAMLLSFGGTRTFHRITCAIEDAGWEIRDTIMWVYGSGFPKSLDISKVIDKQVGAKREVVGVKQHAKKDFRDNLYAQAPANANNEKVFGYGKELLTVPATSEAKLWEGYGTALKPAYEPIILAMNPVDGTFANNALRYGIAGLNIEECRVGVEKHIVHGKEGGKFQPTGGQTIKDYHEVGGRFPANFIHDGSQEVMELFPKTQGGKYKAPNARLRKGFMLGNVDGRSNAPDNYGDSGSAARFFYCAKASRAERDAGLEDMPPSEENLQGLDTRGRTLIREDGSKTLVERWQPDKSRVNNHPTVKPLALMTYLCKLVKMPEYNLTLDPFCGSGSTLLACIKLGIPCIGIDSDEKSCEIAAKRCCQTVMNLAMI